MAHPKQRTADQYEYVFRILLILPPVKGLLAIAGSCSKKMLNVYDPK
jgi:hypothetical protein